MYLDGIEDFRVEDEPYLLNSLKVYQRKVVNVSGILTLIGAL